MATVEHSPSAQASATHVNFARTDQPDRQKLVGRIGPWQLVRLLNEGELARVYVARPEAAPEEQVSTYVIKVLRKEWWRDPQAIEMQRRAAWIGNKVSHPHLLPVLSANVQQPPFYLVSPLLAGSLLSATIEQKNMLSLPAVLWVARQVSEALAALHEATGMIHADVKPSNIFLSPEGHATLVDMGFAHAPSEMRHWSCRPVIGTLHYIAPEVVTSSLAAEPRSDLYSLGVTLYEMLTGALPFKTADPEKLVRQHREDVPTCIRHHRPQLPKPVAELVHRLLAKDPLRRPESAAEVAATLMRLEIDCFAIR